MAAPSATKEKFIKGDLSDRKLLELVRQHNLGVRNDHAVMTLLDGEVGLIDNNYEAACTALEVAVSMDTAEESATPVTYDGRFVTEAFVADLITQQNLRITNLRAIVTKLNGDDGITATDYASTAKKVTALGQTGDGGYPGFGDAGVGPSGSLLQAITDQQAALAVDWHAIAVKLDADVGTAGAYEALLTVKTLSES